MTVISAGPYANLHLDQTHNHASIPLNEAKYLSGLSWF